MTELTILMPCLNEAATVGSCVAKARGFLERAGIDGEVLIADNGSDDGSRELRRARRRPRGRGGRARLRRGARGRDRRGARPLRHHGRRRRQLRLRPPRGLRREAARGLSAGHGQPLSRRHPARARCRCCTAISATRCSASSAGCFFAPRVGDFHCGLRGFDREARALAPPAAPPGMEFASEMVVKAALGGMAHRRGPDHAFIPTAAAGRRTCAPGATAGGTCASCCCSARAGCSSIPGSLARPLGIALTCCCIFAPLHVLGAGLDIHSMLYASAAALLGMQLCLFALFARVSAQNAGLLPRAARPRSPARRADARAGPAARPGASPLLRAGVERAAFWQWREAGFGALDPRVVMRDTIPAATLMVGGMELMLAAFLLSVLREERAADRSMPELTVVVPAFRERENIPAPARRARAGARRPRLGDHRGGRRCDRRQRSAGARARAAATPACAASSASAGAASPRRASKACWRAPRPTSR